MEEQPPAIEIPRLFKESFKHVMFPLIDRFNNWHTLITNLESYFAVKSDACNVLCNTYNDTAKSLHEGPSKNPIIKFLTHSKSSSSTRTANRARGASWKTKLAGLCKQKYQLDYVQGGGVAKNLARMNNEAEQLALLEDQHRKFILTEVFPKLKTVQETVNERRATMNEWKAKHDELEKLKTRAISAYENLVRTSEKYKVNRDSITPAPQDDPVLRLAEYQSLRDRYLHNSSTLQLGAGVHLRECKECEAIIVQTLQSIILQYTTATKDHNTTLKTVMSPDKIPLGEDEEWKYFLRNHPCVPPLPLDPVQPRSLCFANEDHPKTKPLAEASLLLDPLFPWSYNSKQCVRKYVITHGGYLVKVAPEGCRPKREFRLVDCFVMPELPRNGRQSFVLTGVNCINSSVWGCFCSGRERWRFWGTEREINGLVRAMKMKMPVVRLPPRA